MEEPVEMSEKKNNMITNPLNPKSDQHLISPYITWYVKPWDWPASIFFLQ